MTHVLSALCSKCSTPIYFSALSRFLTRPQLLTRSVPLPTGRDISSLHKHHIARADMPPLSLEGCMRQCSSSRMISGVRLTSSRY
jgi:hypothetical protein